MNARLWLAVAVMALAPAAALSQDSEGADWETYGPGVCSRHAQHNLNVAKLSDREMQYLFCVHLSHAASTFANGANGANGAAMLAAFDRTLAAAQKMTPGPMRERAEAEAQMGRALVLAESGDSAEALAILGRLTGTASALTRAGVYARQELWDLASAALAEYRERFDPHGKCGELFTAVRDFAAAKGNAPLSAETEAFLRKVQLPSWTQWSEWCGHKAATAPPSNAGVYDINFANGKENIANPKSDRALNRMATFLEKDARDHPEREWRLVGHADANCWRRKFPPGRACDERNRLLSQARVESILAELKQRGYDTRHVISAEGRGHNNPRFSDNPKDRRNRRVELLPYVGQAVASRSCPWEVSVTDSGLPGNALAEKASAIPLPVLTNQAAGYVVSPHHSIHLRLRRDLAEGMKNFYAFSDNESGNPDDLAALAGVENSAIDALNDGHLPRNPADGFIVTRGNRETLKLVVSNAPIAEYEIEHKQQLSRKSSGASRQIGAAPPPSGSIRLALAESRPGTKGPYSVRMPKVSSGEYSPELLSCHVTFVVRPPLSPQ